MASFPLEGWASPPIASSRASPFGRPSSAEVSRFRPTAYPRAPGPRALQQARREISVCRHSREALARRRPPIHPRSRGGGGGATRDAPRSQALLRSPSLQALAMRRCSLREPQAGIIATTPEQAVGGPQRLAERGTVRLGLRVAGLCLCILRGLERSVMLRTAMWLRANHALNRSSASVLGVR